MKYYLLKYLVIGLVAAFLVACGPPPPPMTQAEFELLKTCKEQRMVPWFYANWEIREVRCKAK